MMDSLAEQVPGPVRCKHCWIEVGSARPAVPESPGSRMKRCGRQGLASDRVAARVLSLKTIRSNGRPAVSVVLPTMYESSLARSRYPRRVTQIEDQVGDVGVVEHRDRIHHGVSAVAM